MVFTAFIKAERWRIRTYAECIWECKWQTIRLKENSDTMRISNDELIALSEIYKTSGKEGLITVLHDKYQIKSTSSVIRRMKK